MIAKFLARRSLISQRADFYDDLAEALKDNAVPMIRFAKQRDLLAKNKNFAAAAIYAEWIRKLENGENLSSAFQGTFPTSDLMLLTAIESSGDAKEGMKFLAAAVRVENEIKSQLVGALAKPIFMFALVIGIIAGVSFYMAPALDSLIRRDQWSPLGQVSLVFVDLFNNYWWLLTALVVSGTSFFIWSLSRWTGSIRLKAEKFIPFYTIYRDFEAAKLLVSLAALMKGNIQLGRALKVMQEKASPWMRNHLSMMLKRLDHEENALRAMDTGLFNKAIMWRLLDYGERSRPDIAIEKIGFQSIDTIQKSVKSSAVILNNVMMALAGAVFIVMVGGFLTTTYGIKDALNAPPKAAAPQQ
jgi:type II secretory pathway component PulF